MPGLDRYTLLQLLNGSSGQLVESTCVQTFDYNLLEQTLDITFPGTGGRGGRGTWRYFNFPLDEFAIFAQASSLGTYFNLYIKDRYSYERIA